MAKAMLAGGVKTIAESRLENIARLRAGDIHAPLWLLRIPALSEVEQVVALADVSLNSEPAVIKALSSAAVTQKKRHKVVIMVELGDLREGVLPHNLFEIITVALNAPGIELIGIGTNLSCFGGVIPTNKNLGELCQYAQQIEEKFGLNLPYISGGNSSSLPLLLQGKLPQKINHLRLGESIFLGKETAYGTAIDGMYQDCFTLTAELIEIKKKPSLPTGDIGRDSFGKIPRFEDKGERIRAIANIGKADIDIAGITPIEQGIDIIGASSDHLLLDITNAPKDYRIGEQLHFKMDYAALLLAMK